MKILGFIVIALVVIGGGYFIFIQPTTDNGDDQQVEDVNTLDDSESMAKEEAMEDDAMLDEGAMSDDVMKSGPTVIFTDAGYSPKTITVAQGDTVTFTNNGSADTWPASAQHPTHTVYPGSNIQKCNTAEANTLFDSCKGIAPGETWSFTFTEIGEWNYHDHRKSSLWGTVVVE